MSTLKVLPIRVPKSLGTGFVAGILIWQAQKVTPRWWQPARRWICGKPLTKKENHMKNGSIILTHEQRVPGVAYLPTAGLAPVKNAPRRGRLPQGVVALRRPSPPAAPQAPAPAPLMDPIDAMRQMMVSMQASLDFAVARLAEYEKAQRRTG